MKKIKSQVKNDQTVVELPSSLINQVEVEVASKISGSQNALDIGHPLRGAWAGRSDVFPCSRKGSTRYEDVHLELVVGPAI